MALRPNWFVALCSTMTSQTTAWNSEEISREYCARTCCMDVSDVDCLVFCSVTSQSSPCACNYCKHTEIRLPFILLSRYFLEQTLYKQCIDCYSYFPMVSVFLLSALYWPHSFPLWSGLFMLWNFVQLYCVLSIWHDSQSLIASLSPEKLPRRLMWTVKLGDYSLEIQANN